MRYLEDERQIAILEIDRPVELIADTNIQKGEAGQGCRTGRVDRRLRFLVQKEVVLQAGAHEENVEQSLCSISG